MECLETLLFLSFVLVDMRVVSVTFLLVMCLVQNFPGSEHASRLLFVSFICLVYHPMALTFAISFFLGSYCECIVRTVPAEISFYHIVFSWELLWMLCENCACRELWVSCCTVQSRRSVCPHSHPSFRWLCSRGFRVSWKQMCWHSESKQLFATRPVSMGIMCQCHLLWVTSMCMCGCYTVLCGGLF